MALRAKVAVLRTQPETVLQDYQRLFELAGGAAGARAQHDDHPQGQHLVAFPDARRQHDALAARRHDPGAARGRLRRSGLRAEPDGGHQRLQGRRSQRLRADLPGSRRPGAVQLPQRGHDVGALPAQGEDAGAGPHLPGGDPHPGLLHRQEHRPPADGQDAHVHDHHRRDEERLRRAAEQVPPLHAHLDPRDAGGPAGDPEGDPPRACSPSWTARPPATGPARG